MKSKVSGSVVAGFSPIPTWSASWGTRKNASKTRGQTDLSRIEGFRFHYPFSIRRRVGYDDEVPLPRMVERRSHDARLDDALDFLALHRLVLELPYRTALGHYFLEFHLGFPFNLA